MSNSFTPFHTFSQFFILLFRAKQNHPTKNRTSDQTTMRSPGSGIAAQSTLCHTVGQAEVFVNFTNIIFLTICTFSKVQLNTLNLLYSSYICCYSSYICCTIKTMSTNANATRMSVRIFKSRQNI